MNYPILIQCLHSSIMLWSVAPKINTKTHLFRRDWTTPSKYDDIYYNLINQCVLGDQYDHFIRTSIFHFDNEQEIHRSSRNYKESGLNLILGLHTILNELGVSYSTRSECKVRACYLCDFLNHVFHILEDVGYVVEKESHLVQLEMRHILCWDAPLT